VRAWFEGENHLEHANESKAPNVVVE